MFSFRPDFFGVGRGQNLDETVLAVVLVGFRWFFLGLCCGAFLAPCLSAVLSWGFWFICQFGRFVGEVGCL